MKFLNSKIYKILLVILILSNYTYAQDSLCLFKNSIYVEIGGNGFGLECVSYERKILHTSNFALATRIGFSLLQNKYDQSTIWGLPIECIALFGSQTKKNFLEISGGWTPLLGTSNLNDTLIPPNEKSNYDYAYVFRVGYRFASYEGYTIRLAPVIIWNTDLPGSRKLNCTIQYSICFGYSW